MCKCSTNNWIKVDDFETLTDWYYTISTIVRSYYDIMYLYSTHIMKIL